MVDLVRPHGGNAVAGWSGRSASSSAATTLNLYAHTWPGDDDRIRLAVDRAFVPDAEDHLRTDGEAQ